MNLRFYNAKILTMADGFDAIEGELHVQGERISYVGDKKSHKCESEISKCGQWDREIDCKGNVLMPGFKNAHTHSAMTFLRSYADDMPLIEWLHQQVFPMEAKLLEEDIAPLATLAIMEYLTSGITANFDMYFHNNQIAQASIESGFRTVLCGNVNDFVGSIEGLEEEYLYFNQCHCLISFQLGFHAEYTTGPTILNAIARLSHKYKAPVYMHNSESKAEVMGCIQRYGKTPMAFLDSIGMFEYGGGGFHCVHVTEEDLAILKNKHLSVITNPASNVKLASGIAPLTKMQELGINIAIGTDGPASNNCLDMFREMFLVTGLQKIEQQDASAMKANDVLHMATIGGAKAMGLKDCDTLEVGKYADLIMIDLHQPNMQPIHNVSQNIVYSGSKQNVKMTLINGKILYEDNQFYIGVDPETIYQAVNTIANRIK